jgi:DNA-binding beta-propeller fold protein YncE
MKLFSVLVVSLAGCGAARTVPTPASQSGPLSFALPGASGDVTVDFIGYERPRDRVWIPVGDTGSVDVFDVKQRTFARVDGFETKPRDAHGRKRMMGPSSIAFGDGVAFVGNRATNQICMIDEAALKLGACATLASPPDAVSYVAATREVWATTPKDESITILDSGLQKQDVVKFGGETEAYAIDGARRVYYTNLENKNVTLAIDIASRTIKATWPLSCADGPRGLAFDSARNFVYVACTDGVEVRDAAHDGRLLAKLETGTGVDLIDYFEPTRSLYIAAGKAAQLTIATVDDAGHATVAETIATSLGVRNAVVGETGAAYAVDPPHARLNVFQRR